MLRNGLRQPRPSPASRGRLARRAARSRAQFERVPGERPGEVRRAVVAGRAGRWSAATWSSTKCSSKPAAGSRGPGRRRPAALDGVGARFVSARSSSRAPLGEVEAGDPAHGLQRVSGTLSRPPAPQLAPGRYPVEAADTDVDGVDGAAAEDLIRALPACLSPRPARCARVVGAISRRCRRRGSRGVQQIDVQRVALDPLAAVEQAAQCADARPRDPAARPRSPAGAGLVGDRADPAHPRGDVGRLGLAPVPAATPRRTAAARRSRSSPSPDPTARAQPHRPLALDPGQVGRLDAAGAVAVASPVRPAHAVGRPLPRLAEGGGVRALKLR